MKSDFKLPKGGLAEAGVVGLKQPSHGYYDSTADSKLRLLELAAQINSISGACRLMNVSRSTYYEIQKLFDDMGPLGLKPKRTEVIGRPKATSAEQEAIILKYTHRYPRYSYLALAAAMTNEGQKIRAGHIRAVWRKRGMNKAADRIVWASDLDKSRGGKVSELDKMPDTAQLLQCSPSVNR